MGLHTKITLIVPYYNQPEMLFKQIDNWSGWRNSEQSLFDLVEIIIVDDASSEDRSPLCIMASKDGKREIYTNNLSKIPVPVSLYKITEDLPWNWIAARNLGAKLAKNGSWLLLTDIDHMVNCDLINHLLIASDYLDKNKYYNFYRVDGPEKKSNPKPHPNSYFMTKDLFWKIGGYDEHYSGHYGTDGIWRRRCEAVAEREYINLPLIQYLPEHCPDAMADLPRKSPEQAEAVRKITENHPGYIKTLSFPWERIL